MEYPPSTVRAKSKGALLFAQLFTGLPVILLLLLLVQIFAVIKSAQGVQKRKIRWLK